MTNPATGQTGWYKKVESGSASGAGAAKPVSGGSSGSVITGSGGSAATTMQGSTASVDYHQQAADAAARGDWAAVEKALAARQDKINQQGGNDRGTSNAQILSQLRNQYGASWGSQPSGVQDRVSLAAGEKLPFTAYDGQNGNIYKDKGWQDGVDYLDRAKQYAAAGDLDGAYDALMRRGFKMSDTGSQGGGTSQDQAYALVHQLYSQSPGARQTYENNLSANQRRLQEHQTQFGLEVRPELAYKQFKSADNKYWIIYDGQGRPVAAKPVGSQIGDGKTAYSREEIDLMSRYYGGAEDWSDLDRQLHNLAVVRTGTGRLVDGAGNWASGSEMPVGSAGEWNGLPETDRNQDRAALQAILDRINAGEVSGTPVTVPTLPTPGGNGAGLTFGGTGTPGAGDGGYGRDYGGGSYGGGGAYGGADLSAYLRELYNQNLQARLAALKAAYEQNTADYRAHDDLLSQAYQDRRNQAAAQNDLQRMYMNEMGAMRGLNTGATGQLALAQSAAYQGSLADLLAAEGQDRAANDLALRKLAAGYQGDMASATAENNAQLAQALYGEMTRQISAAEAARQAAQAQANWQAQFDYQRQQDALAQQNWRAQWEAGQAADRQGTAYKIAAAMLENGIMPDSGTLAEAGISDRDAQAYVNAVQAQLAAKTAKSAGRSGGTSGGYDNGGLSSSQVKELQKYYGVTADGLWGTNSRKAAGGLSADQAWGDYSGSGGGKLSAAVQAVNEQLSNGRTEAANGYLRSVWNSLSGQEQAQMQAVLAKYGIQYTP